jgi:DNA-binding NtrC family response regulator
MVTAVNDARTAVECLRLGAYDYLVKPVSEDDLIFAVKRALERKRLLDILQIERSRQPPVFEHPEAFREILTRSVPHCCGCSKRPSCTPPAMCPS